MSKKKLLIHEVFEKIKKESTRDSKSGWADDLSDALEKEIKFTISGKTLSRYYDSFIAETKEETTIEPFILNKLSQYLDFKDYNEFSRTFKKKGEDACKTILKIDVDDNETPLQFQKPHVTVNITNTNEQNFKVPEFIKQNGAGIMEMALLLFLVTGNVAFSNNKSSDPIGLISHWNSSAIEKAYMYWDGERYVATDSSYISPEFDVVAMDKKAFQHQRKITRKDTITLSNSLGKVWCSKWNNEVDFFTMDGFNPDNGRELKLASDHMILKYAGKQDSIQAEE
ncbi:hypothetical protein MKJ01_04110 [Chryseobacterium sp. SSA4.19]|uniref:hypothetical protein n=1 Tax=Chryseobacterium sp. SSA4.19 TaxID=2919915 RepID=UPI001F4D68EF|nr:hypothetical protein [Chryseobacterium sp. SSA4.19]MCJ8152947.1 hypothetical protein [Chryseobacterium sp. SSA4.19]